MSDRLVQEGAYAEVTVKLGLVKLLTKTFDICEEAYVNRSVRRVCHSLTDKDSNRSLGGMPTPRSSVPSRRETM
jgi:hypothetical protein